MLFRRIARLVSKTNGNFDQFKDIKEEKLKESDINDQLKNNNLKDWKFDKSNNRITRRVSTKDFNNTASELLQSINSYAQRMGVKPDYVTGFDYVEINVSSPSLQGVSQKDVGLAAAIDRLEQKHREHMKDPKSGYRCELSAEDETAIYNSVKGRKETSNRGYGAQQDHEDKDKHKSPEQKGYGQSEAKTDRNKQYNRDTETSNGKDAQERNYNQSVSSNNKTVDQQNRGYGQDTGYAIKDEKKREEKPTNENQPKGPSYRGGSNYEELDCKPGADGYDYQNETKREDGPKGSTDQKHQSKPNPNYTQKDSSDSAYKSGAESNYGKGSKTDQGIRNGSKPDKENSNEPKKPDPVTTKVHNDDQNEYPHPRKEDDAQKKQNKDNKGQKTGSSNTN